MAPAVWFITGASSGMGRTMVEEVLSHGDIVIATLRKPEALSDLTQKHPKDKLLLVKLDVTKPAEIAAAFEKAKDTFGRVDVVFNNAGYSLLGEIESTSDEAARNVFETNFWGSMNVARESVKFFREVNKPIGGRLITNTSIVATVSSAGLGYYTAAKHAIAGGLEALAKELNPNWNIKMTLLMPGGFATRGAQPESLVQTPPHPAYDFPNSPTKFMRGYIPNLDIPGDTKKAMKVVYDISKLPNLPIRLPLGKDAIGAFRQYSKALNEDAAQNESLSEDLLREGMKNMTNLEEH